MEFDGFCASIGVDPLELPIRRFVSLIFYLNVRYMKERDRVRFEADLFKPPPGLKPEKVKAVAVKGFDPDSELGAFKAFAAQQKSLDTKRSR